MSIPFKDLLAAYESIHQLRKFADLYSRYIRVDTVPFGDGHHVNPIVMLHDTIQGAIYDAWHKTNCGNPFVCGDSIVFWDHKAQKLSTTPLMQFK